VIKQADTSPRRRSVVRSRARGKRQAPASAGDRISGRPTATQPGRLVVHLYPQMRKTPAAQRHTP
jgi:hypothetical protein